jgi:excisionase family DNA binding protein
MNKQQTAWLKDGIEYLERVHRWGQPDGLEVTLACEEYIQEGNILACRIGAEHLTSDKRPSPEAALALLSRLEKWARENVPDVPTLTVAEVAKLLRINRGKVLGWVTSGRLKAVNTAKGPGRPRYRIARADLDLFLAGRTRRPETRPPQHRRRPDPDVIEFFTPDGQRNKSQPAMRPIATHEKRVDLAQRKRADYTRRTHASNQHFSTHNDTTRPARQRT